MRFLDDFADGLNEDFVLPKSIALTTAECGSESAYFDPNKNKIVLCYELMTSVVQQAEKNGL